MRSAQLALFAVFSLLCSAAPLTVQKRALAFRIYNDVPISAGNAQAEAVWPADLDLTDLTTISAGDLEILKVEMEKAENTEGDTLNPAITAATGAAADSLKCGKIKNRVLKLTGLSQIRQIRLAQAQAAGEDTTDIEAKLLEGDTKLADSIAIVGSAYARVCGNESTLVGGDRTKRAFVRDVRRLISLARQVSRKIYISIR